VQDNHDWDVNSVDEVEDFLAIASAVDSVLMLDDGDVVGLQSLNGSTERIGVPDDMLVFHLGLGS
jgi:hypothetical protein